MGQRINSDPALVHHPAGNADNCAVRVDISKHNGSGANPRVGSHLDRTENLGTGANHNIGLQGWVPFAVGLTCTPEGDSLVKQAAIAYDSGLPNDHSHAVVDEDALADTGARVDFDTCQPPSQLT